MSVYKKKYVTVECMLKQNTKLTEDLKVIIMKNINNHYFNIQEMYTLHRFIFIYDTG